MWITFYFLHMRASPLYAAIEPSDSTGWCAVNFFIAGMEIVLKKTIIWGMLFWEEFGHKILNFVFHKRWNIQIVETFILQILLKILNSLERIWICEVSKTGREIKTGHKPSHYYHLTFGIIVFSFFLSVWEKIGQLRLDSPPFSWV